MPRWVQDEATWERAKARVRQGYPHLSEAQPRFWRLVTTVYRRMGGAVRRRLRKAAPLLDPGLALPAGAPRPHHKYFERHRAASGRWVYRYRPRARSEAHHQALATIASQLSALAAHRPHAALAHALARLLDDALGCGAAPQPLAQALAHAHRAAHRDATAAPLVALRDALRAAALGLQAAATGAAARRVAPRPRGLWLQKARGARPPASAAPRAPTTPRAPRATLGGATLRSRAPAPPHPASTQRNLAHLRRLVALPRRLGLPTPRAQDRHTPPPSRYLTHHTTPSGHGVYVYEPKPHHEPPVRHALAGVAHLLNHLQTSHRGAAEARYLHGILERIPRAQLGEPTLARFHQLLLAHHRAAHFPDPAPLRAPDARTAWQEHHAAAHAGAYAAATPGWHETPAAQAAAAERARFQQEYRQLARELGATLRQEARAWHAARAAARHAPLPEHVAQARRAVQAQHQAELRALTHEQRQAERAAGAAGLAGQHALRAKHERALAAITERLRRVQARSPLYLEQMAQRLAPLYHQLAQVGAHARRADPLGPRVPTLQELEETDAMLRLREASRARAARAGATVMEGLLGEAAARPARARAARGLSPLAPTHGRAQPLRAQPTREMQRQAARLAARAAGTARGPGRVSRFTPATRQEAIARVHAGESYRTVAAAYGMDPAQLYRWARAQGVRKSGVTLGALWVG